MTEVLGYEKFVAQGKDLIADMRTFFRRYRE
jgi:hypothetical protein